MSTWGPALDTGSALGQVHSWDRYTHTFYHRWLEGKQTREFSLLYRWQAPNTDTWISRIISFLLLTDLINGYPTVYSVQLKHFRSLDYKGHSQQYVRDISWYIFSISVFLLLIYNCHCTHHALSCTSLWHPAKPNAFSLVHFFWMSSWLTQKIIMF